MMDGGLKHDLIMGILFTLIGVVYLIVKDETLRFLIFTAVAVYGCSEAAQRLLEREDGDEQSELLQDH